MYEFVTGDWASKIAAVSQRPEFQTAQIRIEDPSLVEEEYDVETGQYTSTGNPVIYQGQARLIAVGAGRFDRGENQANATTITTIRIQIPNAVDGPAYGEEEYEEGQYASGLSGPVRRGCKVFVISAPRNPSLVSKIFAINSDMQGSSAASRTFEAALDADVLVTP